MYVNLGMVQPMPADSFGDLLGGLSFGSMPSAGVVAVSEVDGKAQDAEASKLGLYFDFYK